MVSAIDNSNNSLEAVGSSSSSSNRQLRAAFTKSSDDLLKSYGLDFSKLSTSEVLAGLDPLNTPKFETSNGGAAGTSNSVSELPRAPPRARRSQQQNNWTTFE